MPAGFGYGAVGRSLMNVMRGAATGAGGRTMQGAVIGAGVGGALGVGGEGYNPLRGAMVGATMGAMGGAGYAAARGARTMGRRAGMGGIRRGLAMAGQIESNKMRAYARSSRSLIGNTWRQARNPIAARAKVASEFFGMREARGFGMPRGGYGSPTMRAPTRAKGRRKLFGMF